MRPLRSAVAVGAGVLVSRLVGLVLLARVVDGREFTDDSPMHLEMSRAPLALLAGDTVEFGQHPVLLPLVEWALLAPVRWVGDFGAVRLAFVAAEVALAVAVLLARRPARAGRAVAVAVLVSPLAWMSSVVMAQDEVVAGAFLAAGLALWTHRRERAATVVVALGVAAGKVFLLLPLVALVVLGPAATRWRRLREGLATALIPYAVASVAALVRGNPLPLTGFTPIGNFGVNLWVFALEDGGVPLDVAKPVSLVLAVAAAGAVLVLVRPRRLPPEGAGDAIVGATVAAMLLWFFSLFYHSNPEYLLLLVPPLALLGLGTARLLSVHALLALAWAVNVFYGVALAAALPDPGGKAAFLRLYARFTSVDPVVLQRATIAVSAVGCLGLAGWLTRRAMAGDGAERARPDQPEAVAAG